MLDDEVKSRFWSPDAKLTGNLWLSTRRDVRRRDFLQIFWDLDLEKKKNLFAQLWTFWDHILPLAWGPEPVKGPSRPPAPSKTGWDGWIYNVVEVTGGAFRPATARMLCWTFYMLGMRVYLMANGGGGNWHPTLDTFSIYDTQHKT